MKPPPVWDGHGEDPWLPARLAAMLDAATAERRIFRVVWDKLASWVTSTAGRVTRGAGMPDPTAVFSEVPAWQRDITAMIQEGIKPVMGWAYAKLLGDGYQWEGRPAVEAYLVGVRNRMSNTPNEVFNLITGQIAAAVGLGDTIPEIAARIDNVLSATRTPRWENRAVVIARTETLGALNASRNDANMAFAEQSDEELVKVWLATMDTRTRESHRIADGQPRPLALPFDVGGFPLMFPGDPSGPAGEVIQCVPADTRVEAGSVRAVTRRWFEGEMVRLRWSSGHELTITPNHPILRSDGAWVPAGLLNEGDYCVGGTFGGFAVGQPYKYGAPPEIGEVYRSASELQSPDRVPLSPPDFHGDGLDGEVEVVSVNRGLGVYGETASEEQVQQYGLSLAHLASLSQGGGDRRLFTLGISSREVHALPAPLGVRCGSETAEVCLAGPGEPETIRLGAASQRQAELSQSSDNHGSADPHGSRDGEHTFSVGVALTQLVKVERFDFRGHVFNLDTGVGWYIGNGITLRNCRCTTLLVPAGEMPDLSDRQL